MPMYFPDLESVKRCANAMTHNKGNKQYKGIIPNKEEEISQARQELGQYFRDLWNDEVQALEIELAVTKENYKQKIGERLLQKF